MNIIGVDFQPNICQVGLREGGTTVSRVQMVGDGIRSLIPVAVEGASRFGSEAVAALGGTLPRWNLGPQNTSFNNSINNSVNNSVNYSFNNSFNNSDTRAFWQRLFLRTERYLGRTRPTIGNGYQTIIALQDTTSEANHLIQTAARDAGFDSVRSVQATDALLCRWMIDPVADTYLTTRGTSQIVTVVVGDTSTLMAAYQLESMPGDRITVSHRYGVPLSLSFGVASWATPLLSMLQERGDPHYDPPFLASIQNAIIEFGIMLSRADAGQLVQWHSPFEERLFDPLMLSAQAMWEWPEVAPIATMLTSALSTLRSRIGSASISAILIGGVGATWPFARQVLEKQALETKVPCWQSGTPHEDIVRGATYWPQLMPLDQHQAIVSPSISPLTSSPSLLASPEMEYIYDFEAGSPTIIQSESAPRIAGEGESSRSTGYDGYDGHGVSERVTGQNELSTELRMETSDKLSEGTIDSNLMDTLDIQLALDSYGQNPEDDRGYTV